MTIKECNFLGENNELVAGGSDDGCVYVWDRQSTQLLHVLRADGEVVNVIQGHPRGLPMFATSGIGTSVKVWQPTADSECPSGPIVDVAEVMYGGPNGGGGRGAAASGGGDSGGGGTVPPILHWSSPSWSPLSADGLDSSGSTATSSDDETSAPLEYDRQRGEIDSSSSSSGSSGNNSSSSSSSSDSDGFIDHHQHHPQR